MLSNNWNQRRKKYDFAVVGSGYGGAIMAARISAANSKKSICLLERGKEWPVGRFPDTMTELAAAVRSPLTNPLGLYDFLSFPDISVIQGSGLGGTSLINGNAAVMPDEEVFQQDAWPRNVTLEELLPYYEKASKMLAARPNPRAHGMLKVKALEYRAQEVGEEVTALDVAVNGRPDGVNPHGIYQKRCIGCGDCMTGCNVSAKNSLYMNYLPVAKKNGTHIFTRTQVDWLEKLPDGGWRIHGRRYPRSIWPKAFALEAGNVILSAGALGTTEVLLRSEVHGLSLSPRAGGSFSGNGDFFGISYNSDHQTNVLGLGNNPDHPWRQNAPGSAIMAGIHYKKNLAWDKRFTVESISFPKAYISAIMVALGAIGGQDTDVGDEMDELSRRLRDNPFQPYREHNALNHSLLYLAMGHDNAKGTIRLDTSFIDPNGKLKIDWDDSASQSFYERINEELRNHARSLGAHYVENPLWRLFSLRNLLTAHPLGGCTMGDDYQHGAVDEFGRVFAGGGNVHKGLFAADGSIVPTTLGVNPLLTICAVAERIADRLVGNLGGELYPG